MKQLEERHAHTPGPWRVGKYPTTVITDHRIETTITYPNNDGGVNDDHVYGGNLIGESILRHENAKLIAQAPRMYEILLGLTLIENDNDLEDVMMEARAVINRLRNK